MKSIMILGTKYKIVLSPEILEGEGICGDVDFTKKLIRVCDHDISTLLHEMFHATLFEAGMNAILPDDIEEMVVENLSQVVAKSFTLRAKRGK